MPDDNPARTHALAESIAIMARLRAPNGCPWDREQTFDSIKRHTLEETYEVFDAIDRRAWPDLRDELGDLLLQVLFYAQMAHEAGHFSIEDVAAALNAKLIRRHPHIFAGVQAPTAPEVNANWEAIKQTEKSSAGHTAQHYLDTIPQYVPAFLEAGKLGQQAAKVGFDWQHPEELLTKLAEESEELRVEINRTPIDQDAAESELGDILFTAVNLARNLSIEPEFALRAANRKFRARFNAMESSVGLAALQASTPAEWEELWRAAKLALPTDSAAESRAVAGSHPGNSSSRSFDKPSL